MTQLDLQKNRKAALHLVLNNFDNDQRVLRAARCAADQLGCAWVFALYSSGQQVQERLGNVYIRRFPMLSRKIGKFFIFQIIKFLEVAVAFIFAGIRLSPAIVHAHDLNTLPIGYLISVFSRCPLIYDSHELWSDSALKRRNIFPKVFIDSWTYVERFFARRADGVITICNSIGLEMENKLKISSPVIVRNTPLMQFPKTTPGSGPLRRSLGISSLTKIFIFQGNMNPGNGLFSLIDAVERINREDFCLVLLGDGVLVPQLKKTVESRGLRQKVLFHPAVSWEALSQWTRDADFGLCFSESYCKSYLYALPNKIFEYIQAGLPIIVSDLPEMKHLVVNSQLGIVVPEGNVNVLIDAMKMLLMKPSLCARLIENARKAAPEHSWNKERNKMENLYSELLISSPAKMLCVRFWGK